MNALRSAVAVGILSAATVVGIGCQSSHEPGVKSSYRTQWVTTSADTQATTAAAKSVFEAEGLKDIKAESTKVDGLVTGKKADGTKVTAAIRKGDKGGSEVNVTVGTLGDPAIGANIAKSIKDKTDAK